MFTEKPSPNLFIRTFRMVEVAFGPQKKRVGPQRLPISEQLCVTSESSDGLGYLVKGSLTPAQTFHGPGNRSCRDTWPVDQVS